MADIDTNWTWNFTGPTTMSKAHSRANLPKEVAWDLIGFDGNETGCLRTHPGFKRLTGSGGTFTPVSGNANVIGFFPVSFLTSSTTYVWGYVWVEFVAGTPNQIKFYGRFMGGDSNTLLTATPTNGLLYTYSASTAEEDPITLEATTDISVETSGRFLLLFVRGAKPHLLTITVSSGSWNISLNTDVGTGFHPLALTTNNTSTALTNLTVSGDGTVFHVTNTSTSGLDITMTQGTYSFACQFLDTTTGRKSALSNIVTVLVPPLTDATHGTKTFIGYQIFNVTGYNRALVYRSVNLGTGASALASTGSPLHLDRIVTLGNSPVVNDVLQTDTMLVYQDIFVDQGEYDSFAPRGGVTGFLGNTLFVSRISDGTSLAGGNPAEAADSLHPVTPASPPRSRGDMRWSSTGSMSVEHFPASGRWVPKSPGHEIIGLRGIGNYLMAFGSDRIYRVGRAGAFIKVEEGHLGTGLQGKYALETIGTMTYFVAGGGLKAISGEGQLDDVTALDNLINVTWVESRANIQLAFDARGQCLTVYQPDDRTGSANGRAAILWFGTNRVTELVDLPFWYARTGSVFIEEIMQRRTLFVKQDSNTTMGVYIVDHERSNTTPKNLCGGTPRYVEQHPNNQPTPEEWDCAVYSMTTGERDAVSVISIPGEAQWSVAPMVQQWVGGNVGMQPAPGQPEYKEFFRQKQISSVGAYFETVLAYNLPAGTTWRSLAYRGTEVLPYTLTQPRNSAGTITTCFSTDAGTPGTLNNAPLGTGRHGIVWPSLSVGWRCDAVGVDVRLLAFSATGKILESDRRYI